MSPITMCYKVSGSLPSAQSVTSCGCRVHSPGCMCALLANSPSRLRMGVVHIMHNSSMINSCLMHATLSKHLQRAHEVISQAGHMAPAPHRQHAAAPTERGPVQFCCFVRSDWRLGTSNGCQQHLFSGCVLHSSVEPARSADVVPYPEWHAWLCGTCWCYHAISLYKYHINQSRTMCQHRG
jgi:hypothetical protein